MKSIFKRLKHFLIPHEHNDFHPHILRDFSVLVITFLSIGLLVAGELHKIAITNTNWLASIYSTTLVDLTNQSRSTESLGGLRVNPLLEKAAAEKAKDMADRGYFAHWSPDGKSPWHWIKQAGYSYMYAGENLAIDFTDSVDVNTALMNSPTHRANIMNRNYTEVGIATHKGVYQGRETVFVVEMFASPHVAAVVSVPKLSPKQVAASAVPVANVRGAETAPEPVTTDVPEIAEDSSQSGSTLNQIITNPHYVIGGGYMLLALLLIIALGGFTTIELRRHHYPHVARCVMLLGIIFSLGYIYKTVVFASAIAI